MNTTAMTVKMTGSTIRKRVLLKPVDEWIAAQMRSTNAFARPAAVVKRTKAAATKGVPRRTWISPASETFGKALLYGLLALAAFANIAWGVLSVVERTQRWPIFNSWVGRILGA
jgi:hypothetical protein